MRVGKRLWLGRRIRWVTWTGRNVWFEWVGRSAYLHLWRATPSPHFIFIATTGPIWGWSLGKNPLGKGSL